MERQPLASLHVSSITVGELLRGTYRRFGTSPVLAQEPRRLKSRALQRFGRRVLAFNAEAVEIWARLVGTGEAQGSRPPADDARIAGDCPAPRSDGRHLQDPRPRPLVPDGRSTSGVKSKMADGM